MDSKQIKNTYKAIIQTIKNDAAAPPVIPNRNHVIISNNEKTFAKISKIPKCGNNVSKTFLHFQ